MFSPLVIHRFCCLYYVFTKFLSCTILILDSGDVTIKSSLCLYNSRLKNADLQIHVVHPGHLASLHLYSVRITIFNFYCCWESSFKVNINYVQVFSELLIKMICPSCACSVQLCLLNRTPSSTTFVYICEAEHQHLL